MIGRRRRDVPPESTFPFYDLGEWPDILSRSGLGYSVAYYPKLSEYDLCVPILINEEERYPGFYVLVAQRFEILQRIEYGGAIFLPLLQGIAGNLDGSRELDRRIVRLVARLERAGMRRGWLQSDFCAIVARRP